MLAETYFALCSEHDWWFEMSDDHSVWIEGRKQQKILRDAAIADPSLEPIWDAWFDHKFKDAPRSELSVTQLTIDI